MVSPEGNAFSWARIRSDTVASRRALHDADRRDIQMTFSDKTIEVRQMKQPPDWERIRHLYKIGIIAAILVLAGDMLLGWQDRIPYFKMYVR